MRLYNFETANTRVLPIYTQTVIRFAIFHIAYLEDCNCVSHQFRVCYVRLTFAVFLDGSNMETVTYMETLLFCDILLDDRGNDMLVCNCRFYNNDLMIWR